MISVIVPVYNAEKFIDRCIRSVLNQTYKDYELILVDDGSKDDSLGICREFASLDHRIVIIDKENGGASSARNMGIMRASGEWVTFLDADDALYPDAFETMIHVSNKFDASMYVVASEYVKNIDLSRKNHIDSSYKFTEVGDYIRGVLLKKERSAPWGILYRSDLVKSIKFDETLVIGEDTLFNLNYLLASVKPVFVSSGLYYSQGYSPCSIMHGKRKLREYEATINKVKDLLCFHNVIKLYVNEFSWYYIYTFFTASRLYSEYPTFNVVNNMLKYSKETTYSVPLSYKVYLTIASFSYSLSTLYLRLLNVVYKKNIRFV